MVKKLPRVHRMKRGNRVLSYHRVTRERLPDLPEDHSEFVAAWAAAESRRTVRVRAKSGTLAALNELFRQSGPGWSTWYPGYRRVMLHHLCAISENGGEARARDIRPHHIQQNINLLGPNPGNARRKAWLALLSWAHETGQVPTNPAKDTRGHKIKTSGHTPWPVDKIAAFLDAHPIGSEIRLGFELIYWTGARCNDARLPGPGALDGGFITYTQSNTGGVALAPYEGLPAVFASLRPDLELLRACIAAAGPRLYWTQTQTGQPRSPKGFSNWISKPAGGGFSANGLRKNRLKTLADCGGSTVQLQAWCGHTSLSEVERYIREASRRTTLKQNTK